MRTVFEWEIALYVCTFFLRLVTIFDFAWTLKSGGVGGSLGGRLNAINTSHPRLRLPSIPNKEFKQWRQRRQWERQKKKKNNKKNKKSSRFRLTKQTTLHVHHPFLYVVWNNVPIFHVLSRAANIWRIKRDGISAIKFHAARINNFLRDVFVAVAVVVA